MVIEGTASQELQENVINTFRYLANVKHRALIAAQQLVLKDVILPTCIHDNYNVLDLSDDQSDWSVRIQKF